MLSPQLKPEQFATYPPEGRELAIAHVALLRQLPANFVALLLREIIGYDWKFPAEQSDLKQQLVYLESLSPGERQEVMAGFERLRVSRELEKFDWVDAPVQYSERLTAHLWATHQIDAFRAAAMDFGRRVDAARTPEPPPVARLGIVILGQGAAATKYRLFRRLRKQGVYFTNVKPENGVRTLINAVAARAASRPAPFGHWYIDGGMPESVSSAELTSVSYQQLQPQLSALLKKMEKFIQSGRGGPEELRTLMAQLRPDEIGFRGNGEEGVLNHFKLSVLTEGSGTQIFSTTFVQWVAREALRRAQPITLLARFAPRQRERSMNELITSPQSRPVLDPEASLIDADMGAYLTWVNLGRLAGAEQASFLAWWEDHGEAVGIGPALPRGTESNSSLDLAQLLGQIT